MNVFDWKQEINNHYPADRKVRGILLSHSAAVARLAIEIAGRKNLDIPEADIEAAAMLHDIGIYLTDAAGIGCHGTEPYIRHGILGAALLRNEGADEEIAAVAERHTGAGITADDIKQMSLPIPEGDYMPRTLLERLICYADKFYSKSGDMKEKPLEKVRASMLRHSQPTLERFEALHNEFGNEDQ